MKNTITFTLLFVLFSTPALLFSQQKCKVLLPTISETYVTMNKLHSAKLYVVFEFVILEPGDWVLRITN